MAEYSDADLISFAVRRYNAAGRREQAIRDEFDLSATRYFQAVVAILDSPERIAALPRKLWPVVKRLDEQRQTQAQQRRSG